MTLLAAVRALAVLALATLSCGGASALPVNALPMAEATFFAQDHWPPAQWVEPTPFVITGMGALDEQTALDEPAPTQLDPSERAARLLALWIRLAAAADRAHSGSLLEIPVSLADDPSLRGGRPLAQPPSGRNADVRAIVPAAGATAWDIGSVNLVVEPLSARESFDSYVAGHNAAAPSNEMPIETLPLRSIQVMPWAGLVLALLAIGWIGWRNAG